MTMNYRTMEKIRNAVASINHRSNTGYPHVCGLALLVQQTCTQTLRNSRGMKTQIV